MHSTQISAIHRQIERLPKVIKFLNSLERNSDKTSASYKTSIAYFHDFLSNNYNDNPESVLSLIFSKETDVYSLLDEFIEFLQTKDITPASINQYLASIRSYLGYYDIDIVPSKFKRRVRIPKVFHEEEEPIDVKDIRKMLLNCNNRRLKTYVLVLASSGLRASEACAIRLCDIDFTVHPTKIHIRKEYTKTRVSRDVWISDEATKYLQDWIAFKHGQDFLDSMNYNEEFNIYNIKKNRRNLESLVFQVQTNNENVTPQSLYTKILLQFQKLLEVSGFNERKEGMKRRKITLHSFRRFVKTILSDCVGKEYSEWYLGHAKSGYYVSKPAVRAITYAEKAMKYLTFLDYSSLEATGKNIESKLSEKENEIKLLRQKDAINTDAISALSDQLSHVMKEIELLKENSL
ncbi:MAG: tyrosine-type recombinase/integrase [Nitrososphaeraceae archaeon]